MTVAGVPKISVIIPFRDALGYLPIIVSALRAQTFPQDGFEVIWVDDASRDGGGRWLQEHLAPTWQLIVRSQSIGWYAARNAALRVAAADTLAFTDADCRPEDDWLAQGFAALARAPRVAGRIHLEMSASPTVAEVVDATRFLRQKRYVDEGFGATANLFVRREVFNVVGEFDETLISGGDNEFGWRCSQAGIPIRYAENAVVHHPARASFRELLRKGERIGVGAGQIARRHGMPLNVLARRARERIMLARKPAGRDEHEGERLGMTRSVLVRSVHLLVAMATGLGGLRGFATAVGARSSDQTNRRTKGVA